jgi:iron complex outermembrane receptor protein
MFFPIVSGARSVSRLMLVRSSAAALAVGLSGVAFAQSTAIPETAAPAAPAPEEEPQTAIVVTGVRASLQSAASMKRNSAQIVDSIVAEDIGKLPDRNVAEALQRIPGIQIQRKFGEGSSVAIRGLTQVRTELNGRDIFTANGGAVLSLEDVPSDLLSAVDVYKNPSADMIEDQLSGLINLRTRKPFDFNGFKASLSASNTYSDLARRSGPSFSGLLSDRWNTGIGEIGVMVAASYQKTRFREDTISTEPFYTLNDKLDANGNPVNPVDYATAVGLGRNGQTTTVPHGTGIGQTVGTRRRFGIDTAVQWRPTDTLEVTAEVVRNDYKISQRDYSFFAFTSDGGINPLAGAPFAYGSNGDFQKGTFTNVPINSNTGLATRRSITTDYSLNVKWKPIHNLTVTGDLQYVRSTTRVLNSIVALSSTAGTLYQDITGATPVIHMGPTGSLTDPSNYQNAFYLDHISRSVGTNKAGRIDAEYKFDSGILKSIKAGFRYDDRKNSTLDSGYRYIGLSGNVASGNYEHVGLNDFFRGSADLFGDILAFPRGTIGDYDATRQQMGIAGRVGYVPSSQNSEARKTYAGYVMAYFDAANLPVPIDGNIGVRVVHTDETASGFYEKRSYDTATDTLLAPEYSPIGISNSYTNALPSLNLRGHLTDRLQLRFAASQNLSRPTFDQQSPSISVSEPGPAQVNQSHSATGGNPYLKPMKSTNLDLSLEWYFSRTGSLTGALFYKDIKNYIQTTVTRTPYSFASGNTYLFDVNSYANAAKAKVKGFELAYQQFFDFLPGPLSGLGMQANFTYAKSQAPSPGTLDKSGQALLVPLENLSKYSYNLVGIYEKGKISARVAYNWRSKFVETTTGNGTGNLPIFDKAFGQLDASITYNVAPHLSFTVNGVNLSNTMRSSYFGVTSRPRTVTLEDRRITGVARITF